MRVISLRISQIVKKRLFPLAVFLLLSLTSPFFIMVFENLSSFVYVPSHHRNVWPYPIEERGGTDYENYPLFNVSPTFPLLFWRVITYDYYDSFKWRTTTVSNQVELPQDLDNTTKVLTVEFSSTEKEIYLPTPSPLPY